LSIALFLKQFRNVVAGYYGNEAYQHAPGYVQRHVCELFVLEQYVALVHECGECRESSAEASREQKPCGGAHQSVVRRSPGQYAYQQASDYVHRHCAYGE